MKINHQIFRTYDIRGLFPQEINEEIAYLIGRAFVKFLAKNKKLGGGSNLKIVVGRDNRLSSPSLFKALTKGILDQGARVINIGLSTTPMLYFAVAHYKYDGGIEISASHLSKEYNGFKLVREKAIPISSKTGLKEIKKLVIETFQSIQRQKLATKRHLFFKKKKGKIINKNILKAYLDFNLKDFKAFTFKPLKIIIDTGNAITGILIPYLKRNLPCQIYSLFEELDGNFPNHDPDPLIKENLKFLQKEVKNKKADLGVAFDGDGDRIIFVDEKARVISGDLITALISKILLKDFQKPYNSSSIPKIKRKILKSRSSLSEKPGILTFGRALKMLYDIRSSNIVPEIIKENGGIPVSYRIGHALIKEKMRSQNIFFAGELSGHYYLSSHYFCEAPLFILFKILKEISESGKSISELIKPLKVYFHTGEINFKVKNKEKILTRLEKKYKKGRISHLDGLRVDFKDWWFLVRPSQTEDLLRLVIEAKTKKLLEKKKKELSSFMIEN